MARSRIGKPFRHSIQERPKVFAIGSKGGLWSYFEEGRIRVRSRETYIADQALQRVLAALSFGVDDASVLVATGSGEIIQFPLPRPV